MGQDADASDQPEDATRVCVPDPYNVLGPRPPSAGGQKADAAGSLHA